MVPDDMSPVGFDDIQFAGFSRIGLTAVRQPRASMGQKVVQLVLNRLHGTEPWELTGIILRPSLVLDSARARLRPGELHRLRGAALPLESVSGQDESGLDPLDPRQVGQRQLRVCGEGRDLRPDRPVVTA
jgi:hypothetical protein